MAEREPREAAKNAGHSIYRTAVDVVFTGIVVIVPLVVTIYILNAALEFIANALNPVIRLLQWAGVIGEIRGFVLVNFLYEVGIYSGNAVAFIAELVAIVVLVVVIVTVGLLARFQYGERVIDYFDYLITTIPGVGSVYNSFRRMGDAMLESGVEDFREVKLVEFPHDDVYVLGFETSRTPLPIQGAAGVEGMTTLFLPLAPNPVMGGFLAHVPDERVRSVDMTVEEAMRTIITSGIAADEPGGEFRALSTDELRTLNTPGAAAGLHDLGRDDEEN
jgi:uncharacterized membrane protein